MTKYFYVYILTNQRNTVLYVGFSSNLPVRVAQHKLKLISSFTKKYNLNKLVYYEYIEDPISAIVREKELKGWTRKKKIALIVKNNPEWRDLSGSLL